MVLYLYVQFLNYAYELHPLTSGILFFLSDKVVNHFHIFLIFIINYSQHIQKLSKQFLFF